MILTVAEIAKRLNGHIEGNPNAKISGISGIREARPGQLAFIAYPRYASAAAKTQATAVLADEKWSRPCSSILIRVKNPDQAFAETAKWFAPPPVIRKPGIHPTAVIADHVNLGKDVSIGPYCVLEPGVKIGDHCVFSAFCYIGHETVIGNDCQFYSHVTTREYTQIGNHVIIHNGTVIGSDGFGYTEEGDTRKKIPQIGIVVIGNDVEIGANATVDRARFGQTRIGNGVKIDNLVQIAHNVIIGDNCVLVSQAAVSGSTIIGDRTIMAGQAGIVGHVVIGSDVIIGAQAGITKDIPSGTYMLGSPAISYEKFGKIHAHTMRLPALKEKILILEKRLAKLEQQSTPK